MTSIAMNAFNRKTALRIGLVSLLVALVASPLAWFMARESIEESIVSLAVEESNRATQHFDAFKLDPEHSKASAEIAAAKIAGGIFDIVEIYDSKGHRLAEKMTEAGEAIERFLPQHMRPTDRVHAYESIELPNGKWILRVFIPLAETPDAPLLGYLEGVRVVSEWQHRSMIANALGAAILAALASLVCGLAIYPVVTHLSVENEKKTLEVLDSHISMMEALGRAIAKRDSDTGAHNYRVAWIAARIAERMGVAESNMQSLIAGSFLHDVGKIGIPDAILLKPGKLTQDEFDTMRTHVAQGEEIVTGMGWLDGAHDVVAAHHEKWDGSGYPRQQKGESIPLAARIFAVADVFDALCSKRPYKEPFSFDESMRILVRDTGSHFDPAVMAAFQPVAREIHDTLAACDEAGARSLLERQIRKHFEV